MSQKKQTLTKFGWCRDGHHDKCRRVVKHSETEDLVCSCDCEHTGDHGD